MQTVSTAPKPSLRQPTACKPLLTVTAAAAATAAGRCLRLGILCPDEHAWKTTAIWLRSNLRYYGLDSMVGPIRFVPMRSPGETAELIGNTNLNSEDQLTNKANENNEVVFTDKKDEIALTEQLNNARKKRRRSSASIE